MTKDCVLSYPIANVRALYAPRVVKPNLRDDSLSERRGKVSPLN